MKRRSFISSLLSFPLVSSLTYGAEKLTSVQSAITPGEKLHYTLGWQFIVAGKATLETLPDSTKNGRPVRNFRMKARTSKAADPFYKVRDTLASTTEYDTSRSLSFTKIQREGDTRRNESIDFNWEKKEARYHETFSGKLSTIPVPENTLDPLSAFYFIRNQKLEVGAIFKGPMTDGKQCKIAEIHVVKREKIKVNGKRYDTFKLVPDIKDIGGVFKKSKNAKIEIWCTTDYRHIPVLMKSKVAVGSFRAELKP